MQDTPPIFGEVSIKRSVRFGEKAETEFCAMSVFMFVL
jgi:hypothetical protein